ncbi:ATP-binding protein [Microbacterium sp. 18062]|uniref:ATP-binding protein n=1 Tax=Microbacterium sp. 18062 TaxID=2681410 RepID=UPI001357314A|nr:ATP-binding protein [Microbacterium sp. 18062]
MTARRRWGFRARLAALIAGVFITGGVVLLGVQYLLVQQLFAQGISTITTGCFSTTDQSGHSSVSDDQLAETCTIGTGSGDDISVTGTGGGVGSVVVQQTTELSQEVLSGLLIWSVIILLVFAGLAVLAARWLSARSLDRISGITATTREITRDDLHRRLSLPGPDDEIKELGDTIDGMLDRLDEAFTRQDRFITGASHELRTPLTTTRTLLEIPLTQGRVPAELEPAVRGALAANARSERLIAALLALARVRHRDGALPLAPEADLSAVAAAALDGHERDIAARSLRLIAPVAAPAVAAAEPELVRIAVGNLVDNAVRHNRDGGELTVHAGTDERGAWIEVSNSGRDLTGTDLSALTEPFHRGEDSRLAGDGLGLGLALVETIARSQGGTLVLTPRDGDGLRARLSFPRRAGDDER